MTRPTLGPIVSALAGAAVLYAIGSWFGWGALAWLCVGLLIGSCGDAAMLVVAAMGGRR